MKKGSNVLKITPMTYEAGNMVAAKNMLTKGKTYRLGYAESWTKGKTFKVK